MLETKQYQGAPFGTQLSRFSTIGIHPSNKVPGTLTQVSYCKHAMSDLQKRLAPGAYEIGVGDFSERTLSRNASSPGWKEALEQKRSSELPHLLYRKEWLRRKELIRRRGPGMYNVEKHDFIRELNSKPRSNVGVLGIKEERFRGSDPREVFPGPGTYGVPHEKLEEKKKISPGKVGLLDSGTFGRRLPTVGCHLAPGRYDIDDDKHRIYNRVVSKKGPFEVFSEDRSEKKKTGHYATYITYNLAPGEYELSSFTDDLKKWPNDKHGKFGTLAKYPQPPTERLFFSSLSQTPRFPLHPGPGAYDAEKPDTVVPNTYPFLFKSKRFDKRSNKFFTGNTNAIGPGRYEILKFNKLQHRYGCSHVFVSKTKRFFTKTEDPFMKERVRKKDLDIAKRSFSNYNDFKAKPKESDI